MACMAPACVALWVSASRVYDNDHHPADVVGGALLGGALAALFYFARFPGIFEPGAHRPRRAPQREERARCGVQAAHPSCV